MWTSLRLCALLLPLLVPGGAWAGDAPDPVSQALRLVGDARPELREAALRALVVGAPRERVEAARRDAAASGPQAAERLAGLARASHLIGVASRYAAAPAESVERWMWLEEAHADGGSLAGDAMLVRAGLGGEERERVLAARSTARADVLAYLDAAYAQAFDPAPVVGAAAKRGRAQVPALLRVLAGSPWREWPAGLRVMNQRFACGLLEALGAREAVPYLLMHVRAPSAWLQFDVLRALGTLTGDPAWTREPTTGRDRFEEVVAYAPTFWTREGAAHAAAARWLALDALAHERDWRLSRAADPTHRENAGVDGGPDPHEWVFGFLVGLGAVERPAAAGASAAEPLSELVDALARLRAGV